MSGRYQPGVIELVGRHPAVLKSSAMVVFTLANKDKFGNSPTRGTASASNSNPREVTYIKWPACTQAGASLLDPFVICLERCLSGSLLSLMLSDNEGQSRRLPTLVTYCQRSEFSIVLPLRSYVDIFMFSPLYIRRLYVSKSVNIIVRGSCRLWF